MDTEKLLPPEERLNMYFSKYSEEIETELYEIKNTQDGNILSVDIEFNSYASIENYASIALALEQHVVQHGEASSYQVMYRSILFAFQTAKIVHGEAVKADVAPYLRYIIESEDSYDLLLHDVDDYLAANPAVAEVIENYTDEIDDNHQLDHLVELAAGMTFMLCERALAEEFLSEDRDNCSVDELDLYDTK